MNYLDEVRQREQAATSGPWFPCGCRYTMISRELNDQEIEDIAEVCNHLANECQIENNKNFIAHARTDIPKLLSLIESLERENNKLWDAIAAMKADRNDIAGLSLAEADKIRELRGR